MVGKLSFAAPRCELLGSFLPFATLNTNGVRRFLLDDCHISTACTDVPQMRQRMAAPVIFDGRNLYEPAHMKEAGFTYYSIGRPAVGAEQRCAATSTE